MWVFGQDHRRDYSYKLQLKKKINLNKIEVRITKQLFTLIDCEQINLFALVNQIVSICVHMCDVRMLSIVERASFQQ